MTRRTLGRMGSRVAWLAGAALLAACDGGGLETKNPLSPTSGTGVSTVRTEPTAGGTLPTGGTVAAPAPSGPRLVEMLNQGIQDEYRFSATYSAVLIDFGDRTPFSNIVDAERQHIDAMSQLFTNRGLDVPASDWTIGTVPRFPTFKAACAAAADAEVVNWRMYAGFLAELEQAGDVPKDVQQVFTNLMEASRDKHLPAFANCAT